MSDFNCSFCAKPSDQVATLVAGPAVCICDECVDLAVEVVRENRIRAAVRKVFAEELSKSVQVPDIEAKIAAVKAEVAAP